ncbi:MAG: TetR/AcrR family transcriptional regulator [Archangium sp.]|nr:TetR/AcrR family transcriptional regulator [Archangium sp.]
MARVKTEEKRRAILEAAAAVFAKRGYHATTVGQIAKHLDMGLGTFYRYFQSKLDVFHAVIEEVMGEVTLVLASESPTASTSLSEYRTQVERIARALFAAFQKNRSLARLLFVEAPGISVELNEKLQAAVTFFGSSTQAYLDNGVARGFLRPALDTELTALAINSMIFEGVRHVAAAGEATEVLERWIAASTGLMFEGISIRP